MFEYTRNRFSISRSGKLWDPHDPYKPCDPDMEYMIEDTYTGKTFFGSEGAAEGYRLFNKIEKEYSEREREKQDYLNKKWEDDKRADAECLARCRMTWYEKEYERKNGIREEEAY